jgi:hypothetical protein
VVAGHSGLMSRDMLDGGGGIRTLVGGISPEMVFETTAFNRSATPPGGLVLKATGMKLLLGTLYGLDRSIG